METWLSFPKWSRRLNRGRNFISFESFCKPAKNLNENKKAMIDSRVLVLVVGEEQLTV